jgi:hypothetical protein
VAYIGSGLSGVGSVFGFPAGELHYITKTRNIQFFSCPLTGDQPGMAHKIIDTTAKEVYSKTKRNYSGHFIIRRLRGFHRLKRTLFSV